MPSFTVHVPQDYGDPVERAERTAFVRDGFSIAAFLFGPLYLLRHRAWIAAALWVIVVLGGAWLCGLTHLPRSIDAALLLLVALFTGLEANSIRRFVLHRRGMDAADVVDGASREDGERAFFQTATARGLPPRVTAPAGRYGTQDEPVIGLFPDAWPK